MPDSEYVLAQRGNVALTFATESETPGTPGVYAPFCVSGAFQVNDSTARESIEFTNWCKQQAPGTILQSTDGSRTITSSVTLDIVPGDEDFEDLVTAYNTANAPIWIKNVRTDEEDTPNTWSQTFKGRITGLNQTDPETGPSQVTLDIEIHEIVANTFA